MVESSDEHSNNGAVLIFPLFIAPIPHLLSLLKLKEQPG